MTKLSERILSSIEESFADKEHKLIGNYDFTDDEYATMVDAVEDLCQKNCFQVNDHKLIFLTLVEITKRWKDSDTFEDSEEHSGFWRFVCKTLTGIDEDNQTLYSQFTHLISTMGKQNQIPVVEAGKKYYATLMMHAFAPKSSIHSFFDLCYNVFKKDLDFGFTSDDEWLCEIVALQIKNVLQYGYREDKAVSIGSSAYSLKIGLRSFAINDDLSENFVKFIKDTFYQINQLFNREIIEKNTRLKRYIVEWWKNKKENEKVSDSATRKKRIATVSKENITAKYIRNEDKILLCIPPIRLDNENNIMRLSVYVNGKQCSSEEMRTKRGELVVSTKEKEIDLNDLLKYSKSINIRIQLTDNGVDLYDSKETLNREFILFEDEKEVLSQINKPSNYFVYSRNIDALKNTPTDLTTYGTNLYNIYPKAGETLTGEIKQVIFVDKEKVSKSSNTICLLGNLPDIEWILDDIHCFVYKDSVKLIVPESTNLKALELKIDNKVYKLDAFDNVRLENNAYMFGLLKLGLLKSNEPIDISLYSYEKQATVLTERLIVLPDVEIKFNKPAFYGNRERKVTISNNGLSTDFSWSNQDNEINCPLCDGNLLIKIPYLKWRIANKEWRNEPINRKLWYKDFLQNGDLLEIDNPKGDEEIKLFVKSDGQKNEIPKNQSGKFEIGRAIYARQGKKDIFVYLSNENDKFELFTVATKEHFTENPIQYINGKVLWNVENTFVGDKDKEFFLAIKSKDNNLRTPIKNANQEIKNLYEDICKVQVKIKDKNIFAEQKTWNLIYEEDEFIIGRKEQFRFKDKCICIDYISSSLVSEDNWIKPCEKYAIYNLKFVEEIDEGTKYEYYEGSFGCINDNKITEIHFMENENHEQERINPVRIELRSNNTFWLKAGYDSEGDFYNENLMIDNSNELCFSNTKNNKVVNLYKFKELKIEYV
ncbi:MAG: hypothetical protein LBM67_07625 [Lentimicrobiaceae bacterium]|jgi:hypothetical protein|nr:hypothetical protein [Lentimicrobiaceae bacterium]